MPIISAVGVAVSGRSGALGRKVEQAMQAAIQQAIADDIRDPKEIQKLILAARDQALADEDT